MPLDKKKKKGKCASSLYADKQQTIIGSSLISLPIDTITLTLVAVHQKAHSPQWIDLSQPDMEICMFDLA